MTSDWLACLWCMHMHRLIVGSTSSDCWTAARLCYCRHTLELMQRRLMYTLWRERVLVPEQILPRLISCSIGMLPGLAGGTATPAPITGSAAFPSTCSNVMLSTYRHLGERHAAKHGGTEQPQKQLQKQQQCRWRQGRCVCYRGATITCTDPRKASMCL
jgi:hypothetical protein